MLWLSLHLPHLALELFASQASAAPLLVHDGPEQRPWVHARNRAAAQAGIRRGMPLSAARSLCATLTVLPRNRAAEAEALTALAQWAGQFTPTLRIEPLRGLQLEIGSCLKLFGGVAPLREAVATGLATLGYRPHLAIAPTPLGSWLLAVNRIDATLTRHEELCQQLAPLALSALELDARPLKALQGLGITTIGELLRLPRDGTARRLGPELFGHLDRLLGHRADPRPLYQPPDHFSGRVVLPAPLSDTSALLFALQRLLLELGGFLTRRGAGVQSLDITLHHPTPPHTPLNLRLLEPSRSADHLLSLLRVQLERQRLAAPVEELALDARQLAPLPHQPRDLFSDEAGSDLSWPQLLERLEARLGNEALRTLAPRADHRPEHAWQAQPLTRAPNPTPVSSGRPRPLWLLPHPQPLAEEHGHPCLRGRLQLLGEAERIEAGWWDGGDTARDYYIARGTGGERYWLYRDLRGGGWFLHGEFA